MTYHRTHPFPAKIKERYSLTKSGSTKSAFHVTLDIAGSDINYKVGDSVGIYAPNDPVFVERILTTLKLDPQTHIQHPRSGHTFSLQSYLETQANLARVSSQLVRPFNPNMTPEELSKMDLLDFAKTYGSRSIDLQHLIAHLSPLLPRFYSVASSQKAHPDEIHLLVGLTTFQHNDEVRFGVASHFLCSRAQLHETVIPCYVQPAQHFTLPENHQTPIIMIGPGTGVAPFRAFMQERIHSNSKNWLFFGERNQKTDFFYEDFWSTLAQQNKLKLDVAFSRDQTEKLYVQHKLLENGADIWAWLEEGAHFYVCGDADPMAKDIESAVLQISMTHGNLSIDQAKAYLKKLRQDKRYLADVY